jgi:hypothetical protein
VFSKQTRGKLWIAKGKCVGKNAVKVNKRKEKIFV